MCDLFILDNSIGRDVGDYPQLADFPKDYDYDAIDSVYELKNYRFEFPKEGTINFPLMKMEKKAKLTDVLSCAYIPSSMGRIISPRLKEFMSNYNLENVKFYPCKVLFKDEIVEYFYMHILDLNFVDCNKVIDFNNSFIYDKKIDKYFTFKNIEGIKEFFSIIRTYNVTKVFKLKYIPKELFKLPFRIEILVKREIKEEIKKQKFSGIEFEEIENLTLQ